MLRVSRVGVLVWLMAGSVATAQDESSRQGPPIVVTTGNSVVRAAPDRAYVTVATEATAPSPVDAQQKIARAMTDVRAKLQGSGVPSDAIKTVAYSVQEEADYVNGRRMLRGYRASNAIEIRVDDIERVGAIIDAAVTSGASSVSDIRFDLRDRDGVERQALKLAVGDARARAEAIAAGAGVTIASIVRIEEQGRPSPPPRPVIAMAAMRAADAPPPTPVSAGEIEVQASVTLIVSIK